MRTICNLRSLLFLLTVCLYTEIPAQNSGFGYSVAPDTVSSDYRAVGSPSGNFAVSSLGGATYSIPLEVPQGLPEATPQVGITYNSQSGNGVAGYGCNITGISVISRGVRDIYHDYVASGIGYTADDAFYLDGQRLIRTEEAAGSDSAVYCTESDPYTRVVLHGITGGDASTLWFSATTKEGIRYEYGTSNNAVRSQTNNGRQYADAWYLCKATSPTGNYITYGYVKYNLCVYLSYVEYGQNETASNTLQNRIEFTYEDRNDILYFRVHGQAGSMAKRLKTVTSKTNNSLFRKYRLTYDDSSGFLTTKFSRLTAITESNGNDDPLKPITLGWQPLASYTTSGQSLNVDISQSENSQVTTVLSGGSQLMAADLNNDGISDIIHKARVIHIGNGIHYCSVMYTFKSGRDTNGNIVYSSLPDYTYIPSDLPQWGYWTDGPLICDFNGDGRNDVLTPYVSTENGHYVQMYFQDGAQNYGYNFTAPYFLYTIQSTAGSALYTCDDFDKNGRSDVLVIETAPNAGGRYEACILRGAASFSAADTVKTALQVASSPKKLFTADYNGDGMNDLMIVHQNGYDIFWNQGGGLNSTTFSSRLSVQNSILGGAYRIYEGDFNGDGLADYLTTTENSPHWYMFTSNGDGTFSSSLACTLDNAYKSTASDEDNGMYFTVFVYDMDGDGKTDLFVSKAKYKSDGSFDKVYTYWLISNTNSLVMRNSLTSTNKDNASLQYYMAGDFNGDGLAEIANYGYNCYAGGNRDSNLRTYVSQTFSPNSGKITSFTDGYGKKTTVSYGTCTTPSLYQAVTQVSYPLVNCTLPIHVVSDIVENQGTAYAHNISYNYRDLKCHVAGKGLLGMGRIARRDWTLQTYTYNETTLDANYLPEQKQEHNEVGNVSATTITNFGRYRPYPNKKTWYVYPSTISETDFDGNTFSKTFSYDFSKNGVPTQSTVTHADGEEKTLYLNYSKYGGRFLPADIIKRTTYTGKTTYTEKTHLTYTNKGLRESVISRYLTTSPVTTAYTYDNFGNMLSSTTSATGVEDVVRSCQYDGTRRFVVHQSERDQATDYTYDLWGNVLTKTDNTRPDNPYTITYTYNGWGHLLSESHPTGRRTTYIRGWNNDGTTFLVTQGTGQPWTRTWFGKLGEKTRQTSVSWLDTPLEETFSYNTRGQLTHHFQVTGTGADAIAHSVYKTYDNRGRLLSEYGTGLPATVYTYGQNTVTATRAGRSTGRQYDLWGNIVAATDTAGTVTYQYASHGHPTSAVFDGNTVSMEYDAFGRRISMQDPDAGLMSYTYDAYDRTLTEVDAKNNNWIYIYDDYGRMTRKSAGGHVTSYTYGHTDSDRGLLLSAALHDRTISYSYDNYGRLSSESRIFGSVDSCVDSLRYNNIGQLAARQYVGGPTVTYTYDAYGYKDEVRANGTLVSKPQLHTGWEIVDKRGTNLVRHWTFDQDCRLADMALYDPTTFYGYDQGYFYDSATGNLEERIDMFPCDEQFSYDALDRLTEVYYTSGSLKQTSYAPNGNITNMTGVGNYYYGSTKPHAVTEVDNTDDQIPHFAQNMAYFQFGKIAAVWNGGQTMSFVYGPDGERWKTTLSKNSVVSRTITYLGDCEQIEENGNTRRLYYLDDDAIYVKQDSKPDSIWFMFKDRQGSIISIVDYDGNELFCAAYDAWGRQTVERNDIGFHRGYTGHEMMPEFGLINMNGRLYDPQVCRFTSTDNYVQEPFNSQSFNRYSYCLNNPLKYSDPSGELFGIDDIFIIGGVIVGAYIGGTSMNDGELNPLRWNYGSFETYLGMGFGGIIGGTAAYGIVHPGTFEFLFSVSSPWATVGASAAAATGALGAGTNWKWNLHWTTAAGGGGTTAYSPSELDEKVGAAFDEAVESMRDYYDSVGNSISLDYVHSTLDAAGMVFDVADAANAALYGLEGDYVNAGISAAAMVPFFGTVATTGKNAKKAFEIIKEFGPNYTKSSIKQGIEIHKSYRTDKLIKDVYEKEYRGIPGIKPDYVDFEKHSIYELKPYNPRNIRGGIKQLEKYKRAFEARDNMVWNTFLDFY